VDVAGATRLACEVVSFVTDNDPANGSAEIWVKIPSISSSVDTDFYIWWEKSGESQPPANDTYGSQNTWDSNYCAVWHMENSSGTLLDSTLNNNNGTFNGANLPSTGLGKIGNAQVFNGSDDYVSFAAVTNIPDNDDDYTLQSWIKPDVHGTRRGILYWGTQLSNRVNAFRLQTVGGTTYQIMNYWWGSDLAVNSNNLADGAWHLILVYFDGTDRRLVCDNQDLGGNTPTGHNVTNIANLVLGRTEVGAGVKEYFDGLIDEVRISDIARSVEWLSAEYNNQNDPATFIAVGTPLNGTPGTPIGGVFKSPIFGGN